MTEKYLDTVYNLNSSDQKQRLYQEWASSYDEEVCESGYATPDRVARALKSKLTTLECSVLDYGCGTGLSGLALKNAGFMTIDGMDPSPEMLAQAEAKGAYRNLSLLDLAASSPIEAGIYDAITCIGVIGVGAAPPETFDLVMHALDKGGILAFSYNDLTLKDHRYMNKLCEWVDCGAATLVFRENGPHLPKRNMKSDVYIVVKN